MEISLNEWIEALIFLMLKLAGAMWKQLPHCRYQISKVFLGTKIHGSV